MFRNFKSSIKVEDGVSIKLLRNIDQIDGLCNGTRLFINGLYTNIIGVIVIREDNLNTKDEFGSI